MVCACVVCVPAMKTLRDSCAEKSTARPVSVKRVPQASMSPPKRKKKKIKKRGMSVQTLAAQYHRQSQCFYKHRARRDTIVIILHTILYMMKMLWLLC